MSERRPTATCPACGSALSLDADSEGLCPRCLVELALESPTLMTELQDPAEAETVAFGPGGLSPGDILGRRYRIRSLLGTGGMGEVWQATDLKLRVDVALKALRTQLLTDERALESLRQEVRAAREVVSPNVCRVFDLVEIEEQELVSMEYIDGVTLFDVLRARAPLELSEAREMASQFLAGLEAIHDAGLVHRDVKPENLMITRSGRVVLMDFGIAKGLTEGSSSTVSGTPAYMSPEQARGQGVDARSDVYSAAVVLAEMTAPEGLSTPEARQRIWDRVRRQPPELSESPWAPVLKTALAADREQRPASAAALARELEEVTQRIAGVEDAEPYPGLDSFSEEDAEYFFGRELEVESMWKRLHRSHLLALIGPSGAGKSSFLRAGLLAVLPSGWKAIATSPGAGPFSALARALVPELSNDTEALQWLTSPDDPEALVEAVKRWRQNHAEALLIVDQFEELFTQNPQEKQERFAELLARFALEADVHVLLAMRDDFLARCSHHPSLAPIFTHLTPLKPLTGSSIRRALVEPALKCGYRFESDSLVDEMLTEVSSERGALPLLAFAASRLWDHRDRERGLLTREAYDRIGGVAGALARHAERTLETIGRERLPVVRELFRNLVTAQGTRAVCDRQELLSVFSPDSEAADEVLDALIDARLLTTAEVPGDDEESETSTTQVEIIHESLLSAWPRLVRWQTQDADGAQLRDQIRQAARIWEERGRPEDLLWTGTSFSEYRLWRERYSGGLTTSEDDFVEAMTLKAERRVRRRRATLAAAFVLLLATLAVVGFFWRQSAAQTRRAEASQLLTLAGIEIDKNPVAALAYARSSLDLFDTRRARMMLLDALWRGPVPIVLEGLPGSAVSTWTVDFSPDGRWLATGDAEGNLKLWSRSGGPPRLLATEGGALRSLRFGPDSKVLAARSLPPSVVRLWSIPEGRVVRELESESPLDMRMPVDGENLLVLQQSGSVTHLTHWPLDGSEPVPLGRRETGLEGFAHRFIHPWPLAIDPPGRRLAFSSMEIEDPAPRYLHRIRLIDLGRLADADPRLLVSQEEEKIYPVSFHPDGRQLAAASDSGVTRIWSLTDEPGRLLRSLRQPPAWVMTLRFDPKGAWLASASMGDSTPLFDLAGPPMADGIALKRGSPNNFLGVTFHPDGDRLATASDLGVALWPVDDRYARTLRGHTERVGNVLFHPRGDWLISASQDSTLRLWPLSPDKGIESRILLDTGETWLNALSMDGEGEKILVGTVSGEVWLVPIDGTPELLTEESLATGIAAAALSRDGRFAAVSLGAFRPDEVSIQVWDLETGEILILDPEDENVPWDLEFTPDGRLLSSSASGLRVWDLEDGSFSMLHSQGVAEIELSEDGRFVLASRSEAFEGRAAQAAVLLDLDSGTVSTVDAHGPAERIALDPSGQLVVTTPGGSDPFLRVSRIDADAPHLIFDRDLIARPRVSPDGRWIASPAAENTIRLWPMPDLSTTPLQTLPKHDLLERLDTLTNVRVVEDRLSETGWRLSLEPFPGWEERPTW